MAANFNLAQSIFLGGDQIVTLLAELKSVTKFAFSILDCLVATSEPSKVGIISGFSSLKNNNTNITSVLIQSHLTGVDSSTIAEADVALVVDFGDVKETVKLASLQRKPNLSQHEHGLFVQRCSVNNKGNQLLPEPERLTEIRNRVSRAKVSDSQNSSFVSWKILEGDALKNKLSGLRREREDDSIQQSSGTNNQENGNSNITSSDIKTLSRFQDHRVSRLQGQLSDQLSALSQSRNEVRSLQSEVNNLTNKLKEASNNNSSATTNQTQQQQSSSSSSNQQQAAMVTKLATTVSTLTTKVTKMNSQMDELISAGAAKFNVEPTLEAVMEAMQK